jgi:integrase
LRRLDSASGFSEPHFYAWTIEEGLTHEDPTAKIRRPKMGRLIPRPVNSDELADALRHANPKVRCWILLAAYGGLPCQEIAGLRTEDVLDEPDGGYLRIVRRRRAAAPSERLLPLHPEVLEALRALPMPRQGFIFERPWGGRYTPANLSHDFNKALRKLGVRATAHQLRHWFGTNLYANTKDLRVVQEMMGHASPTTGYAIPPF